jgi:cytochrome b
MASATPLRRVWDLPTRLLHWLLAATVVGSVVSAKIGGNAMAWHLRFGYLVLALLLFRLLWGFVGGHWSRFAAFVPTPARVLAYLRGGAGFAGAGHNPLGALSVLAMLVVLAAQVATGLVADDEIATTGPLYAHVGSATSAAATFWHKAVGQWLVYALVALHLAAIVYHDLARRRGLVRAMLSGDRPLASGLPASADGAAARGAAALVFAVCAGAVLWLVGGEL